VSELNTDPMKGKRPFEESAFARFDFVDSAIRNLDSRLQALEVRTDDTNSRLQKLEIRAYDTKPIWERAIKEIVETRRELSKRLDRIDAMSLENRADLRDVEDRLDKIEPKLPD
jgi:chromosome segregation ATPase